MRKGKQNETWIYIACPKTCVLNLNQEVNVLEN